MSEQGWILDVFSLEIRQDNVEKVSFCAEGLLDANFSILEGPEAPWERFWALQGRGD